MNTKWIMLLAALAAALAGCGGSSSDRAPKTATVASQRVTPAAFARAFISYDNVKTRPVASRGDGCTRLAIIDSEAKQFAARTFGAWVVISPGAACGASLEVERQANRAQHIARNIWIDWPAGVRSQDRLMVQAVTTAAYVVMTSPGSGYGA